MVVTANQRPVGNSYPYYIGTMANFFDPGYRAATEYALPAPPLADDDQPAFAALQSSLSDRPGAAIVPQAARSPCGARS